MVLSIQSQDDQVRIYLDFVESGCYSEWFVRLSQGMRISIQSKENQVRIYGFCRGGCYSEWFVRVD